MNSARDDCAQKWRIEEQASDLGQGRVLLLLVDDGGGSVVQV